MIFRRAGNPCCLDLNNDVSTRLVPFAEGDPEPRGQPPVTLQGGREMLKDRNKAEKGSETGL